MGFATSTFLDKDFTVDNALFEKLKVKTLATWEELELRAALSDTSIDMRIFSFMLVGALFYESIDKIVLHAFETPCIDKLFTSCEVLELIYKVYPPMLKARMYSGVKCWLDFASAKGDTDALQRYHMSDLNGYDARRHALLKLADAKFPLTVVEFYNAHRKELQAIDSYFELWLLKTWSQRKSPEGKQIYEALARLHADSLNVKKFMN